MAHKLPEPGYYTSNGKDVLVLDPLTVSPSGVIRTKDGNDANWRPAVAFRPAFAPGDVYVLSADVFDGRFKPTTQEEALKRVQDAEAKASLDAARDAAAELGAGDSGEDATTHEDEDTQDATAEAEGVTVAGPKL